MKKLFFALAAGLLLASACNKEDDASPVKTIKLDEPFTLALNQTAILEPDQLKITFTKVKEDSRCPLDAICVWEGRAVVELSFEKGGETKVDSLATISTMPNPADTTTVFNRKIRLIEVTPWPQSSTTTPQKDYKVKIVVN